MWQQLLERFVPLMDDDASALDLRDGVGRSTGLVLTPSAHTADAAIPVSRIRAAYEGTISPLPS